MRLGPQAWIAACFFGFTAAAWAQEPGADPASSQDETPVLQREVFRYPGAGRRDPFRPLDARDELGPRFEDLALSGIILSPEAGSMVVLVNRPTGQRYRVWEGDVIGGATLTEVRADEAIFRVTVFGVSRRDTLRLESQQKEQGG